MNFLNATSPAEIEAARVLFKEYEAWLGLNLCFQNFEQELAELPGKYAPPDGRLFLVFDDEQMAGCVALRRLSEDTCEMKRLFLRPAFRGRSLGRRMVQQIIEEARRMGYRRLRLDTLPGRMDQAIALYGSFGFTQIEPYYDSPISEALFMELKLQ
ncbi:MAG: GNAT family N-acetyltransferase [Pyrinomonadaceae bacterium]